jgi:hypothetical protein
LTKIRPSNSLLILNVANAPKKGGFLQWLK